MKKVLILGAGISGLTVADELSSRGYQVTVIDYNNEIGGKARSYNNENGLPSEHGFRFYLQWYKHLRATLKTIPLVDNPSQSVHDNLIPIDGFFIDHNILSFTGESHTDYPTQKGSLKLMTACDARLDSEYEDTTWREFVYANFDNNNEDMLRLFLDTPKLTASTKSDTSNVRAMRHTFARLYSDPGAGVMNAPTNVAWFDHWEQKLKNQGVEFVLGSKIEQLTKTKGQITSVTYRSQAGKAYTLEASLFVSALPALDLNSLITETEFPELEAQALSNNTLEYDWQAGIQFYLNQPLNLPRGHWAYTTSPWALTGIQQTDFWTDAERTSLQQKGYQNILSVIIADWHVPGLKIKKAAKECTSEELKEELIYQMIHCAPIAHAQQYQNLTWGDYHIDEALTLGSDSHNRTPLFMNTVSTWEHRPDPATAIPNLFVTGDYLKTTAFLATMESACESGKRTALTILNRSKYIGELPEVYEALDSTIGFLKPLQKIDEELHKKGLGHVLDFIPEDKLNTLFIDIEPFLNLDAQKILQVESIFEKSLDIFGILDQELSKVGGVSISDFIQLSRTPKQEKKYLKVKESMEKWNHNEMGISNEIPEQFPAATENYINVSSPIYDAVKHVNEQKGNGYRAQFAEVLNLWFEIPSNKLYHFVELLQSLHNCSLLIDDIMDNTTVRRNQAAAHTIYGINQTINASYSTVFNIFLSSYIHLGEEVLITFLEEGAKAHLGQAQDVYSRDKHECLSKQDYLEMISNKTGCAFRLIGNAMAKMTHKPVPDHIAESVSSLCTNLGYVFQIRDDYMDIISEEYAIKKGTRCSDFEEGKFSYPVITCLTDYPEHTDTFLKAFDKEDLSDAEKDELIQILIEAGAIIKTEEAIRFFYEAMIDDLETLNTFFNTPFSPLNTWIKKLVKGVPGIEEQASGKPAVAQKPKKNPKDIFKLDQVKKSTLHKAIRSSITCYPSYFEPNGWSKEEFWEAFPILLLVELLIYNVDDKNEESDKGSVLSKNAFLDSSMWNMISSDKHFIEAYNALVEQAKEYYEIEAKWNSQDSSIFDQECAERMTHLKSIDFRIISTMLEDVLGKKMNAAIDFHLIEDYVTLLNEESQFVEDSEGAMYNIKKHFDKVSDTSFETHKEVLKAQLDNAGLTQYAQNRANIMFKPLATDEAGVSVSFEKVFNAAKEVALQCNQDEDLSGFTLQGNFNWIYKRFLKQDQNPILADTVLKDLKKRVMHELV